MTDCNVEQLRLLVEESLYHLRLDERARDYHERALAALNTRISPCTVERNSALNDIAAERHRQIDAEGWTPEHDDEHSDGELALAAACYAAGDDVRASDAPYRGLWPWHADWWKPGTDRRRRLVKAAALLVAEIERLDRAAISAMNQIRSTDHE